MKMRAPYATIGRKFLLLSNDRAFSKYASDNFSSTIPCFPAIRMQGWSEKNILNNKIIRKKNGFEGKALFSGMFRRYKRRREDEIY